MSVSNPCDISANQQNQLVQGRIEYLQNVSVPPNYGSAPPGAPPRQPERARLNCIKFSSIADAKAAQAAYKKDVLGKYNPNTFRATSSQKLDRVMNGFTASGQLSAQYGTQNWSYTNSTDIGTQNVNRNNQINCDPERATIPWFCVVCDISGESIIASTKNNIYYADLSNSAYIWAQTASSANITIPPTPYLTESHYIGTKNASVTGTNYVYKSTNVPADVPPVVDGGVNWIQMYPYPTAGSEISIISLKAIVSDLSGDKNLFIGFNTAGTTMIGLQNTNYTSGFLGISTNKTTLLPLPKIIVVGGVDTTINNYVKFTDMTSAQDISTNESTSMDMIYACGYCNAEYNAPGFTVSTPGSYIWKSDTSGNTWDIGINPHEAWQLVQPNRWGVDVSLSTIATSKYGKIVAVAGRKPYTTSPVVNFWINTNFGDKSYWGAVSEDNGFAKIPSIFGWYDIAISDDGQTIAASSMENTGYENSGYVYVSLDQGVTVSKTSLSLGIWVSLAIGNNGQVIVAASNKILQSAYDFNLLPGGDIYVSNDYGVIWTRQNIIS